MCNNDDNNVDLPIGKLDEVKYNIKEIIDLYYNHNDEVNIPEDLIYIPIANKEGGFYRTRRISLLDMMSLYNYSSTNAINLYNVLAKNNYVYDVYHNGEKLEVKDNKLIIPKTDLTSILANLDKLNNAVSKSTLELEFELIKDVITNKHELFLNGKKDINFEAYEEDDILFLPIKLKINKDLLVDKNTLPIVEFYEYRCGRHTHYERESYIKVIVDTETYLTEDFLYVNLFIENVDNLEGKIIIK